MFYWMGFWDTHVIIFYILYINLLRFHLELKLCEVLQIHKFDQIDGGRASQLG